MHSPLNRLAVSVALASSVIASQQAQAYQSTQIPGRPIGNHYEYVGMDTSGGTYWNAKLADQPSADFQAGVPRKDGTNGKDGLPGKQGERGEQGLAGPAGPRGEAGPAGKDGLPGLQGERGEQGIVGPVGPRGETGPAGKDGKPGLQGERGEQGVAGPVGAKGETGPVGKDGRPGLQGERGEQGIAGPAGPRGETGPAGKDGTPGLQGERGEQGVAGPVGPQGQIGPAGRDGTPGLQGERGEQGVAGPVGPQGEIGPTGKDGLPGLQGERGEQGLAGPAGPRGETGLQGAKGDPGKDGAQVNAQTLAKIDRNEKKLENLQTQLDDLRVEGARRLGEIAGNPENAQKIADLEHKIANLQAQADDPRGGQGGNTKPPIPKPIESPLQNALAGLNATAKRDAWAQLSGAANANLGRATLKGASQVGNSALSAMRQLGNAPSERLLAGANGAPGQVSLSGHSQIKPTDTRLWVQALNNASHFEQAPGQKDFEQNTQGLVMGVDWALDNEWRVGLLGGKSQSEHKASRFEGNLDSWHVGTYALHQSGPVALRLGAIHSDHSGKTKRNVEFGSYKDRLAGNYNATSQQAFAELGYNLGTGSLIAEPFANLGYQRYSRKGYTEKGGEAALKASAQTLDNFSTTFGLRTASIRNMDSGMSLAPRLSAGWKHLYGALDDTSTQVNQVTGRTFNTKAIGQDRDSLVVEAGLDLNLSARHSIGVAYNGEMGSSSRSNGVMGQWKMAF
ncbi:autotransporter domain-containing protein [Pseudomonas gingeri]|uniref:autotransporter domain-containing protein n=1 Tax=Pseudomonas gingeri TaxID=117681 RepID=UPI0015A402A0|nr:autotransporter domain-containing protein [Pseudomonas gingeri]NWD03428.1 autotransporter domain-containing protein [Pseudomonas gingeri]NWE30666.1 autotransporter domain-containing protein [Pseudomonas gingeri]NWE56028.1 autotransporter domain-containing protein [Pseudomonas gingeri]NWF05219.1 autotransporter domain-containing protein [Pseudomonas gingeri]